MHLLTIFLSLGILGQHITEGLHIHPYKPCNCDDHHKKNRIKRSQIETNLEPNHLHPLVGSLETTAFNNNQFKGNPINDEVVPPNHLQWNMRNQGVNVKHEGNDKESDIVGLAGLAHIHALAARAKARAAVARVRARARLHRPLLLEATPEEFLNDDAAMDHSQNNFQVTDPILSMNSAPHQNFDTSKPMQQTTPLQLDMSFKQHQHGPPSQPQPSNLKITNVHRQLSHLAVPTPTQKNNFERPINSKGKPSTQVDFPNLEVVVPTSLPNSARSAENYEEDQYPPPYPDIPTVNYNPQPEIRIHNIDNSEEVYQNRKPGFSIIPVNWKPPPYSNLYVQGEYEETNGQEPILAVFPGKWTDGDDYDTDYYEDYDVIPIAYNIPEETTQNYYGRSAESEEVDTDEIPEQFVGIKKQLQNWEENPMIWRPNPNTSEQQQRAAEPSNKRHFHHGHSHTFVHKHIHNHGKPVISEHSSEYQSQHSGFAHAGSQGQQSGFAHAGSQSQHSGFAHSESQGQHSGFAHAESQGQHSGFAHAENQGQHSGFAHAENQGQHSGFAHSGSQGQHSEFFEHQLPESSGYHPVQHSSHIQGQHQKSGFGHHLSHGHSLTINHQKTTVVVPPNSHKNIAVAQVTGTNNAVTQSQSSSAAHQQGFGSNGFAPPPHNSNFQSAQVSGHNNAVTQTQGSEAPFVGREPEGFLGAPYLINFPSRRDNLWRTHNDAPQKFVRKRSVDDNTLDNDLKADSKFSKKLFDFLMQENKILKEIKKSAKYDKELLFITEVGSNLLDHFEKSLKPHSITKRTVPILRLIADPNAKLDVPKTLENMGTVARNSFENKRAPMYHIKNLAGSAKDAFLSTLRIVPQDFLVPSRYKIIDREGESAEPSKLQYQISKRGNDAVGAITPSLLPRARSLRERIRERHNPPQEVPVRQPETAREPEDPYNFSNTYTKVGSMLRESVRSGQEALSHMGEIYHSTRKALATARHSAPRVLLSSMRIPAVQHHPPLLPHNDKVLVIAPKIVQLKQEAVGAPHYSDKMDEMVGMGHVMDSLGISKPDTDEVGQRRIVFHPANIGRTLERRPIIPNLQARSNFAEDVDPPALIKEKLKRYFVLADTLQAEAPEENVQETMEALDNAREAVGASSLKEFVLQMKDGLSSLFKDKLEEARDQLSDYLSIPNDSLDYKKVKGKILLESEGKPSQTLKFKVGNPLSHNVKLSQYSNPKNDRDQVKLASQQLFASKNIPTVENQNEQVGAGLLLPKQLLTPFMGQPSKAERRQFFEELGDSEELSDESSNEDQQDKALPTNANSTSDNTNASNQEVIGAINPIIFNETFQLSDSQTPSEFLAASNGTKHANHTNSKSTNVDSAELWEHKCNYTKTTTKKAPEGDSKTSDGAKSTTKIIIERGSDETDEEIEDTTTREEEETTKKIEAATKTDARFKNQNKTNAVGTSMKMGKALLTPFMGKPYTKVVHTYYNQYDDSYEGESYEDGYLGNPIVGNPEQLQVLPTDGSKKKITSSSRKLAAKQKNNLDDSLEQNLI